MRLIDADKIQFICAGTTPEELDYVRRYAIDRMPTVDAVPVAFCDKCKHWDRDWKPNHSGENEHYCPMIDLVTDADFFCKYGERKGWDE